ncbi:hypothetical protein C0J52_12010 [Blattella germanica]|nr:hypothetical protein C0J52_12010 [Blattella germanica]
MFPCFVNIATIMKTVSLPDDYEVPFTTYQTSYRPREVTSKYMDYQPPKPAPKPIDNSRPNEKIRAIMKVRTGDSEYEDVVGGLGGMIMREQMHGEIKRKQVANEFELMRQQEKLK